MLHKCTKTCRINKKGLCNHLVNVYIYILINRDMSSVKHTSLHELNYMKTDFPSPLCKYHYSISVS